MLDRNRFALLLSLVVAAPLGGCILVAGDSGTGGGTSSSTTDTTTTTTTTDTTTSSTTTSSTTTSTSTGMEVCLDPAAAGTGVADSACDSMANFPKMCADSSTPIAITACHATFSVFSAEAWEAYHQCLTEIPATTDDACTTGVADQDVKACGGKVYEAACANTKADDYCDAVDANCKGAGDTGFNAAQCKTDLAVFGLNDSGQASGLEQYRTCVNNNASLTCDKLHDTCFAAVLNGG